MVRAFLKFWSGSENIDDVVGYRSLDSVFNLQRTGPGRHK